MSIDKEWVLWEGLSCEPAYKHADALQKFHNTAVVTCWWQICNGFEGLCYIMDNPLIS